jgi:EmrB/QacA subfamily drug resistance transporter
MKGTPRRVSLTLFVVSAAILFDALDLSITQVGLPSIERDLDLSPAALPWVANAYVLTYGGLLLLGGRAADLVGRRGVFVSGLVLFGVMSLVCGLAPSGAVLIAARGLQGIGAALTVPAAVSIIATTFPEGQPRNRALGIFAACASAGFAVGLVLGGVVTDLLAWRWIFLVKVPAVLAVALLSLRVVDGDRKRGRDRPSYDLPGAIASSVGLLVLVFVITQLADRTLPGIAVAGAALVAAAALVGFVVWEGRTQDPLLPLDFFRLRTPRAADLASLTVLAAPFGFSYVATLFLQNVQGYSALETGLALLPGAVLSAVVSRYAAPALIRRFGLRASGVGGLLVVGAGFALLLRMETGVPYAEVMLPANVICFGIGMGISYPVFTTAAVTGVEDARQGLAAGIQSTALQVGGGFGLALVSAGVAAGAAGGADPSSDVAALQVGAVIGTVLPLIGAVVAFVGLRPEPARRRARDIRAPGPAGT